VCPAGCPGWCPVGNTPEIFVGCLYVVPPPRLGVARAARSDSNAALAIWLLSWCRRLLAFVRSLPPKGGRLPPIQKIQMARATALATGFLASTSKKPAASRRQAVPSHVLFCWFFLLAIPRSLAHQERRAKAFMVRRAIGALYPLLTLFMERILKFFQRQKERPELPCMAIFTDEETSLKLHKISLPCGHIGYGVELGYRMNDGETVSFAMIRDFNMESVIRLLEKAKDCIELLPTE
jgi:hypothetical protein